MAVTTKFKKFFEDAQHVLSISYKPTTEEFTRSAKLIVIGILLIGFIGFIVAIIVTLITTGSFSIV